MDLIERAKHPLQPIERDETDVPRFRENKIVSFLLEAGPFDMNQLNLMPWEQEDWIQFYQLIGYSVSGFQELRRVDDGTWEQIERLVDEMREEQK